MLLLLIHVFKCLKLVKREKLTWNIWLMRLISFCRCLHSLSFLSFSLIKLALSVSNWISLSLSWSFSDLNVSRSYSINLWLSYFRVESLLNFSNSTCWVLIFTSEWWFFSRNSSTIPSSSSLLALYSWTSTLRASSFPANSFRSLYIFELSSLNFCISSSLYCISTSCYLKAVVSSSSFNFTSCSLLCTTTICWLTWLSLCSRSKFCCLTNSSSVEYILSIFLCFSISCSVASLCL